MANSATPGNHENAAGPCPASWKAEALAVITLLALAVFFLAVSWRKWTYPVGDSGTQWYTIWRLAHGAALYHDVPWNYGPLSVYFNALLFRFFGPGMMVLVTVNLAIYTAILALLYLAFRKAWGPLGAFAATAVFISVFSFSRLNNIANYNYATPYAHESTHGLLLLLVTIFVAVRWCRGASRPLAFVLGLCGGLTAVLKPEYMLASGILGITACVVRILQRQRAGIVEYLLMALGAVLPTLMFTVWFDFGESLKAAFMDASQAWWLVLVDRAQATAMQQQLFLGIDHPGTYAVAELKAAAYAFIALGAIWAAGWIANRPWRVTMQAVMILAAGAVAYHFRPEGGWLYVGASFPGLALVMLAVLLARLRREFQQTGRAEENTLMAFALVLMAGVLLLRMALHARVTHFGFYQAALTGMAAAAFMVAEVPRWTGPGKWGRCLTLAGCIFAITFGCVVIARQSHWALADQTVPVGEGRDRFYADAEDIDATGAVVDWVVKYLKPLPPETKVCVLPEGLMINYLSRRVSPLGGARTEEQMLEQLRKAPPEYVVLISRDLREAGIKEYGAPGGPGYLLKQWLLANRYAPEAQKGGNPLIAGLAKDNGAVILRRPPATVPLPAPATKPSAPAAK